MSTKHTFETTLTYLTDAEVAHLTERQEIWFNRAMKAIGDHDKSTTKLANARVMLIESRLEIDYQSKLIRSALARIDEARVVEAEAQATLDSI